MIYSDYIEKQTEIAILEATNELELEIDKNYFNIYIDQNDPNLYQENVIDSIANFFKAIRDAISNMISKIIGESAPKSNTPKIDKTRHEPVRVFNFGKYIKAFSDYSATVVSYVQQVVSKSEANPNYLKSEKFKDFDKKAIKSF